MHSTQCLFRSCEYRLAREHAGLVVALVSCASAYIQEGDDTLGEEIMVCFCLWCVQRTYAVLHLLCMYLRRDVLT